MAKSRLLPGLSGQFTTFGNSGNVTGVTTRSYPDSGIESVTVDNTAGNHVTPNAFYMSRTDVQGGMVSGSKFDNSNRLFGRRVDIPFPSRIYDYRRAGVDNTLAIPGGLNNMLYARASPDRADILLPVFAYELRELPGLIRELGLINLLGPKNRRRSDKTASKLWLSGNFGWAPLLSDLKKLVLFSDATARREKEFAKLYSQNGLRRKVKLHSASGPLNSIGLIVDSIDASLSPNSADGYPTIDIWGTVRYTPEKLPDGSRLARPTPKEIRRKILGLNAANVTLNIWEAIPWSWLIDYFVDVGDYLGAFPIGRTAVPSNGCIMVHRRTKWHAAEKAGTPDREGLRFAVSAGSILAESKQRTPVYPSPYPTVLMNPLSGHQLSILGAIKVLRARRS